MIRDCGRDSEQQKTSSFFERVAAKRKGDLEVELEANERGKQLFQK